MRVGCDICSKDAAGIKRDAPEDQKTENKRQIVPTIDVTSAGLQKDLFYKIPSNPEEGFVLWVSPEGDKEILEATKDHGLSHIILIYDQHVHSIMMKMNVIWK